MKSTDRQLSPVEAARQLGVTVKALRVYETRGLLKPIRSHSGWRAYGPDHIARVHEILALKALGLSLKQIGDLLRGRAHDLSRSLAAHRRVLQSQRQNIDRALLLVDAVERKVAAGHSPQTADLALLVQSISQPDRAWGEELAEIYDRHLGPAERKRLSSRRVDWSPLIVELKRLAADKVDPASPSAQKFWRMWIAAGRKQTGGDLTLDKKSFAAWSEALRNPQLAPRLPIGKVETDYLMRIGATALRSAGANQ